VTGGRGRELLAQMRGEDWDEAEQIDAALLEQGYYREDIPLKLHGGPGASCV